jgi:tRNA-binding protein
MLSIFYNKNALKDTLIIHINDGASNEVIKKNNICYGLNENKQFLFVNIFEASKHLSLADGYLILNKEIIEYIKKEIKVDLQQYNIDTGLVIGKIIQCEEIPNSHLHKCIVDVKDEQLQIVCGAKNAKSGIKVVVAKVGVIIPNGLKILKNKFLGIDSIGMLCSATELKLTNDKFNRNGIVELPDDYQVGEPFLGAFTNSIS